MMFKTWTCLTALCTVSLVSAVQNVKVQGSDFVNNVTSDRLQIIGVAYQPGGSEAFGKGSDPLSNATDCLRDAALMQMLGTNTIRVYNVDPTLNHDECVSIFNAVGIYILLDVNSPLPGQSLNPGDLAGSYTSDYLNHIFSVVEAFKNYENILGFFAGNEVMNDVSSGEKVPPYLRAVTRDLTNYISKHSPRLIPVGYSAADVQSILVDSWAYLSCAIDGNDNDPSRSAFFGLNSYSWCGPTSPTANYVASSYNKLIEWFGNTSIPVFFSEYGCNKVEPRVFDEVGVLYGNMTDVLSGGIVYEYYEETNDYGLVAIADNGTANILTDYNNLQTAYSKLNIKALESGNSSATMSKPPQCSKSLIQSSNFNTSFTLPSVPSGAQDMINNGISNPPSGKMVSVTQTSVALPVYNTQGNLLQGLAIKPLADDQSNTPGTSTSNSNGSTNKKKNDAAGMSVSVWTGATAGLAVMAALFCLV